jgi:predicted MFS family arabinose efflux permease
VYYLSAAKLVNCLGSFIMPLLTLILTQKLGMTKTAAGSFASFLIVTQAPCLILGGKLADVFDRKKLYVLCGFTSALCYVFCFLNASRGAMIWAIVAAADFAVMGYPASDAMLADMAPRERSTGAFSLMYLSINVGMAVSPVVGGLLFKNHLALLFLLDAATTMAAMTLIMLKVHPPKHRGRMDETEPAENIKKTSLAGVLKASPVLTGFILILFAYDFCYVQWGFMLPAQFGDLMGADGALRYSLLCSLNALTVILLTPMLTTLLRRVRPLVVVAAGGGIYTLSYIGLSAGGVPLQYAVLSVLFTIGEIFVAIRRGAFIATHVTTEYRGRVSAFSSFVNGAATSLGPLVMGPVITARGYTAGWLIVAAIMAAGGAGMLALDRIDSGREIGRE